MYSIGKTKHRKTYTIVLKPAFFMQQEFHHNPVTISWIIIKLLYII